MIDENYNTWLIEINKNPALEYSTVCLALLCITNLFRQLLKDSQGNYSATSQTWLRIITWGASVPSPIIRRRSSHRT